MNDGASKHEQKLATPAAGNMNGSVEFPDASFYTGEYIRKENVIIREGNGVYTYADKSTYSGQWHFDRQHGEGWRYCPRLTRPIRLTIHNMNRKFELCGWWIIFRKARSQFFVHTYDQQSFTLRLNRWADGLMRHGTLRTPVGDVYTGEFERGQMNGVGTIQYARGAIPFFL
jgi:hypothetical protein